MNPLSNKRILVTGGAGVIGRELLKRLIDIKAEIMSIDREPHPKEITDKITAIQQDIAKEHEDYLYEKYIKQFNPHAIFHLAAAFERSLESPSFWDINWRDNIIVSHRIINSAFKLPHLKTFVFASSYLVYSPSLYLSQILPDKPYSLKEDDMIEPRNLVGAAKYYSEKELEFLSKFNEHPLSIINSRIFRVYGRGSKDVISRWVRLALAGKEIEVYNGNNRFDYIFAGDVAEGLLRCAYSEKADGPINLASGLDRAVRDVVEILKKELHVTINDMGDKEAFESNRADVYMLNKTTQWTPKTSLEEGIKRIIEYEKEKPQT